MRHGPQPFPRLESTVGINPQLRGRQNFHRSRQEILDFIICGNSGKRPGQRRQVQRRRKLAVLGTAEWLQPREKAETYVIHTDGELQKVDSFLSGMVFVESVMDKCDAPID
jgi:hypothetical protein